MGFVTLIFISIFPHWLIFCTIILVECDYFHQHTKFCVYKSVSEWRRCMEFVVWQNGGHIEHMFSSVAPTP